MCNSVCVLLERYIYLVLLCMCAGKTKTKKNQLYLVLACRDSFRVDHVSLQEFYSLVKS